MLPPWERTYESAKEIIYTTDRHLSLTHLNRAWDVFALANGAGPKVLRSAVRGTCLTDCIPEVLRSFYEDAFQSVLSSGQEWGHLYSCSSPTEIRKMHMRVLPFGEGLLFINSLVSSQSAEEQDLAALHTSPNGIVTMCANCRRTRVCTGTWVWVPSLVATPGHNVSHGLCEICLAYHYPEQARRRQRSDHLPG